MCYVPIKYTRDEFVIDLSLTFTFYEGKKIVPTFTIHVST